MIFFFAEIEKPTLKLIWNFKRHQIAETIFKKNIVGGLTLSDFKLTTQAIVIKMVWYWHKDKQTNGIK